MSLLAGQKVTAAALNVILSKQVIEYAPPASDATGSTVAFADWIVTGGIIVPPWAVVAWITGSVNGIYDKAGSSANEYRLRFQIGSDNSASSVPVKGIGDSYRFGAAWQCHIDLTSTGTKSFDLQAIKVAGASTLHCDGNSIVTALVEFTP